VWQPIFKTTIHENIERELKKENFAMIFCVLAIL